MKKERNCNMSAYPGVIPNYSGMMYPGQMVQMPGMMSSNMGLYDGYGDFNSINSKLNSLEQRIIKIENIINGSNYNSNNYQMM